MTWYIAGLIMLVKDITKNEHGSTSYYIAGKHAGYIVTDIEAIFGKRYPADELFGNKVKEKVVNEKRQTSS